MRTHRFNSSPAGAWTVRRFPGRSWPGAEPARTDDRRWCLARGEVQVWRVWLDAQPADDDVIVQGMISADEAERARRFYFERDRRRFLVGRGILRAMLASYLDCGPKEIALRYGPNGKPALASADGGDGTLHFNLAHSEGLAVYAFTRGAELGVDVEHIREMPEWEQIAHSCFSAEETAHLYAQPAGERRDEFFRAWTRQEALLKAVGVGLGGSSEQNACVSRQPAGRGGPRHAANGGRRYQVQNLELAAGYAAAIATAGASQRVAILDWAGHELRAIERRRRTYSRKHISENGGVSL